MVLNRHSGPIGIVVEVPRRNSSLVNFRDKLFADTRWRNACTIASAKSDQQPNASFVKRIGVCFF